MTIDNIKYDYLINIMRKKNDIILLQAAYILVLVIMFILPFYSVEEYSIIRNTLSQLGAQNAPNAWIMNLAFVLLGIGSIIAGWRYLEDFAFHRIFLTIFSLSLIMTAFFNHAPVGTGIQFNHLEDAWHSYFATATGLSFVIFSILTAFVLEMRADRILSSSTGIIATILSSLMLERDQYSGIWQRLIFIICFGWLIYIFCRKPTLKNFTD